MIKTQVICDRCGENCSESGTTYYTIDVYGHDISPTSDGRVSSDTAVQNIATNMNKMVNKPRHYCRSCKNEIEQFLKEKV